MPLTGTPPTLAGNTQPREQAAFLVGPGCDFPTIQAAIAGLPAGGGTIFVKDGVFPITAPIVIGRSNVTIVGDAMGRTIIRAVSGFPNNRSLIEGVVDDGSTQSDIQYIRILNLQLDGGATSGVQAKSALLFGRTPAGSNPAYKADNVEIGWVKAYDIHYYGIKYEGSATVRSLGVYIHDTIVDKTQTEAAFALGAIYYSVVRDCIATRAGLSGFTPDACTDLLITGNHCFDNIGSGIRCEDTTGQMPPARIVISNNTCRGNGGRNGSSGIAVANGAGEEPAKDCVIIGNVCVDNTGEEPDDNVRGIAIEYGRNCIVTNNICRDNNYGICVFDRWDGNQHQQFGSERIVINSNRCYDTKSVQKNGLYLEGLTRNVTVVGNDFTGNVGADISGTFAARGASPVDVAARVPLAAGSTTAIVTLPQTQVDLNFLALAVPDWNTTIWASARTLTTVTFSFGNPVPGGGGKIDVFVLR